MKEKLQKLIDVKTIVTFVFVIVYQYLVITNVADIKVYESLLIMIVSFYFGTQVGKKTQ